MDKKLKSAGIHRIDLKEGMILICASDAACSKLWTIGAEYVVRLRGKVLSVAADEGTVFSTRTMARFTVKPIPRATIWPRALQDIDLEVGMELICSSGSADHWTKGKEYVVHEMNSGLGIKCDSGSNFTGSTIAKFELKSRYDTIKDNAERHKQVRKSAETLTSFHRAMIPPKSVELTDCQHIVVNSWSGTYNEYVELKEHKERNKKAHASLTAVIDKQATNVLMGNALKNSTPKGIMPLVSSWDLFKSYSLGKVKPKINLRDFQEGLDSLKEYCKLDTLSAIEAFNTYTYKTRGYKPMTTINRNLPATETVTRIFGVEEKHLNKNNIIENIRDLQADLKSLDTLRDTLPQSDSLESDSKELQANIVILVKALDTLAKTEK